MKINKVSFSASDALDFTEKWLEDTVKCLKDSAAAAGGAASDCPSLRPLSVHNHAYLRLLSWDHASDPFPEVKPVDPGAARLSARSASASLHPKALVCFCLQTVLMDQVRFQEMQQEVERLVLLSSVLLIVYTTTGEAISGLPGLMETLKNTVSVLLADMHTP